MTHMLLCHGGVLASKAMSVSQHVASYWAAAVHDYEHGGLNNDFLIKTAHPWALLYNDISPLENHHCSAAASLMGLPEYGFIEVKKGCMYSLQQADYSAVAACRTTPWDCWYMCTNQGLTNNLVVACHHGRHDICSVVCGD